MDHFLATCPKGTPFLSSRRTAKAFSRLGDHYIGQSDRSSKPHLFSVFPHFARLHFLFYFQCSILESADQLFPPDPFQPGAKFRAFVEIGRLRLHDQQFDIDHGVQMIPRFFYPSVLRFGIFGEVIHKFPQLVNRYLLITYLSNDPVSYFHCATHEHGKKHEW